MNSVPDTIQRWVIKPTKLKDGTYIKNPTCSNCGYITLGDGVFLPRTCPFCSSKMSVTAVTNNSVLDTSVIKPLTADELFQRQGKPVFYHVCDAMYALELEDHWRILPREDFGDFEAAWESVMNDYSLREFFDREPEEIANAVENFKLKVQELDGIVNDLKSYREIYGWKDVDETSPEGVQIQNLPADSGEYWVLCKSNDHRELMDEEFSLFWNSYDKTWQYTRVDDTAIDHMSIVAWKKIEPYKPVEDKNE